MDDDLLVGRKEILDFLRLSDWEAVIGRIKEGLPVEKVCGRLEMSKRKYRAWRDEIRPGRGIVGEDGEKRPRVGAQA
jgi:hypothetical protein